jgi:hypothetical protein
MKLTLREFVEADDQTTFENGVVRNVLVLGSKSKNKRQYAGAAMKKAVPLYENVAVYVDHPTKEDKERHGRSADDRFGVLRDVRFVEQGREGPENRGDLHYLTTHPMAPRVAEDWKRGLNFFGLSHLADGYGRTEKGSGLTMVESIDKVVEVDLVTNPATAMSLREQEETPASPEAAGMEASAQASQEAAQAQASDAHEDMALEAGVLAVLKDPALSTEEKAKKIQEIFEAHLKVHEAEAEEEEAEEAAESGSGEVAEQLKSLSEQVATVVTENKKLSEQLKALKRRRHLPGAAPVVLAEQTSSGKTAADDLYPENGTPAERGAWLRRREHAE